MKKRKGPFEDVLAAAKSIHLIRDHILSHGEGFCGTWRKIRSVMVFFSPTPFSESIFFSVRILHSIPCLKLDQDITYPRMDVNFIFEWSTGYLISERSEPVRYRVEHKVRFIM